MAGVPYNYNPLAARLFPQERTFWDKLADYGKGKAQSAFETLWGAATLPGDVYAGKVDQYAFNPQTGEVGPSPELMRRSADLAGSITLGAGAVPVQGANVLRMGINPFKFTQKPPSAEDGYVYHATSGWRANDIADEGKLKTFKPNYGTDQDMWPDGSVEKRSYWTETPATAVNFVPEDGGGETLLRVKKSEVFKKERGTGDIYSPKPIKAEEIEYLDEDGTWKPLKPKA